MALMESTRTLCRAGSMTRGLVGPMEKPRLPQRACASSCSDGMAANKQQPSMVLILPHCSSAAGDTAVWKRTQFRMNTYTKSHSERHKRLHTKIKPTYSNQTTWIIVLIPLLSPFPRLITLTLEPSTVLLLDAATVCEYQEHSS